MIYKNFSEWSVELAKDFIRPFEGEKLTAYLCPAGVWTIGVGHTGAEVHRGLTISKEQSEQLYTQDLIAHAKGLGSAIQVPVNKNQFIALLSFCFNIGIGAARKSEVVKYLNLGDIPRAADSFMNWVRAGGKRNTGLVNRRKAERLLFLKEGDG